MRNNYGSIAGQTLIETLAALFILAMGVSASVGLAVYALSTSTGITKEIIGTGLAREGLEAVRNMRDTNWLQDTLSTPQTVGGCYDFVSGSEIADCYPNWLKKTFCLDPAGCSGASTPTTATYYLGFDASPLNPNFWVLNPTSSDYGLNFNSGNSATFGFYNAVSSSMPGNYTGTPCIPGSTSTGYCRKIIITEETSSTQYSKDLGPLLYIQSQVWWADKKCPLTADWPGPGQCSTELDTYLTNWKNY